MDRQTTEYVARLVRQSTSDPNPNNRRAAAAQAQQILMAQVSNPSPEGDDGRPMVHVQQAMRQVDPLEYRGRPQAPHSTVHLDQVHPPIIGSFVTPLAPPSRVLVVPGIPAVLPGTTSNPARIDFTAAGGCDNALIIGIHGTVRDDTAGVESAENYEYATCEVQATFNDSENLITDGEAATFVPYSDLFSPGQREPFPIMRMISATDKMFFRFRNRQPAETGNTLQPTLALLVLRIPYPGS